MCHGRAADEPPRPHRCTERNGACRVITVDGTFEKHIARPARTARTARGIAAIAFLLAITARVSATAHAQLTGLVRDLRCRRCRWKSRALIAPRSGESKAMSGPRRRSPVGFSCSARTGVGFRVAVRRIGIPAIVLRPRRRASSLESTATSSSRCRKAPCHARYRSHR